MRSKKGNRKNYINYEKQERECGICHEIKPFNMFSTERPKGGYKPFPYSYCKKCCSIKVMIRVKNKQIAEFPWRYYQCADEDCNKIWSKSRGEKCIACGGKHGGQ